MGTTGASVRMHQKHMGRAPDLSLELTKDFLDKRKSVLWSVSIQPSRRELRDRDKGVEGPGRRSLKKKDRKPEKLALSQSESSSARSVHGGAERG